MRAPISRDWKMAESAMQTMKTTVHDLEEIEKRGFSLVRRENGLGGDGGVECSPVDGRVVEAVEAREQNERDRSEDAEHDRESGYERQQRWGTGQRSV